MNFMPEETLLCALMTTDYVSGPDQAALLVRPEDFQDSDLSQVYRAILNLSQSGQKVDCMGCVQQLEGMKAKEPGMLIARVFDAVPVEGQIERYAKEVKRHARMRSTSRIIQVANARIGEGEPLDWVKANLIDELGKIETDSALAEDSLMVDSFIPVVSAMRDRMAGDSSKAGLRMGISALDQLTTGINREELWVVGGMPGRGKTAFALQATMQLVEEGIPVYFISLEMSRYAIMRRLLRMKFGSAAIEYPSAKQMAEIGAYEQEIRSLPFYINDSSSLEIDDLISRAHMRIKRTGIRLVVVDYIQLIRCAAKDRRERVSEATDQLRRLAKDTGVPVIALSQLRRAQNVNERPTMIDLKESGDIEAHAHVILLLYMPVGDDGSFTNEDEIIIGKQREGPTGKVEVCFVGTKGKFFERERQL